MHTMFPKAVILLSVSYIVVVMTVNSFAAPLENAFPAHYGTGQLYPRAGAYIPVFPRAFGLRTVSGANESSNSKGTDNNEPSGHLRLLMSKRIPYYGSLNVIEDPDDFLRKRAINDDPEPIEFLGRK